MVKEDEEKRNRSTKKRIIRFKVCREIITFLTEQRNNSSYQFFFYFHKKMKIVVGFFVVVAVHDSILSFALKI